MQYGMIYAATSVRRRPPDLLAIGRREAQDAVVLG